MFESLVHYNTIAGPNGERLATTFGFQGKPHCDFPQIFRPFDSLLNHKSRLVRNAQLFLGNLLTPAQISELQIILACHDVPELIEEDVSRIADTHGVPPSTAPDILDLLLLPEDVPRYRDFEVAQRYLENGLDRLPQNPLSLIARILDTLDGNYFAFATLSNYAVKVGGSYLDPNLQFLLEKLTEYVNSTRKKYCEKIYSIQERYEFSLLPTLEQLQSIEKDKLDAISSVITRAGYSVPKIV